MKHSRLLLLLGIVPCTANDSGLGWNTLNGRNPFRNLPVCAQKCLSNAYLAPEPGCSSYGCVCSEDTLGPNYLASWQYVTDCAAKDCPEGDVAVIQAGNAFRDICAEAIDIYNNTLTLHPQPTGTTSANSSSTTGSNVSTTSTATLPRVTGGLYHSPIPSDPLHSGWPTISIR
jgi:CFEM domain-containing protein